MDLHGQLGLSVDETMNMYKGESYISALVDNMVQYNDRMYRYDMN